MNENFSFSIDNLACELLSEILTVACYPRHLTQRQKESQKYYDEVQEEFIRTLTQAQKENFNSLDAIKNDIIATTFDYHVLLGMRIKVALDKLIEKPLEILELYDSKATKARDLYKFVSQEENLN